MGGVTASPPSSGLHITTLSSILLGLADVKHIARPFSLSLPPRVSPKRHSALSMKPISLLSPHFTSYHLTRSCSLKHCQALLTNTYLSEYQADVSQLAAQISQQLIFKLSEAEVLLPLLPSSLSKQNFLLAAHLLKSQTYQGSFGKVPLP